MLGVAIGWLAAQPVVSSVIAGDTTRDQVRADAGEASAGGLAAAGGLTRRCGR